MRAGSDDPPRGNAAASRGEALYDHGRTTIFASRADPRFAYCLYVPPPGQLGRETALVVVVHGTGRTTAYRDAFSQLGRWRNCVVLAPLFPVGPLGDGNRNGFKYMVEGDIRYDRVLLGIVDEVAERYCIADRRFALWGYSGGGHFAHRFFLLHPGLLWAAAIGAAGSVTRIDDTRDWWVGTRDIEARFGIALDRDAMRRVSVQMIVGGRRTWRRGRSLTSRADGTGWRARTMPGRPGRSGSTRWASRSRPPGSRSGSISSRSWRMMG